MAVERFLDNPAQPGLRFKKINNARGHDVRTFRASLELRVLVLKVRDSYVLIEAGHHDPILSRAENLDLAIDPRVHRVQLLDLNPETSVLEERLPELNDGEAAPRLLEEWRLEDLIEMGLSGDLAERLFAARTWSDLDGLPAEALGCAIDAFENSPSQWRQSRLDPEERRRETLLEAISEFGALSGFTPFLAPDVAKQVLRQPIEDWMVFLHPDQLASARAVHDGPARVRGGPGTGKTVLALHRAAALASRYPADASGAPRVLFTSFSRSLVGILGALYRRIPGTDPSGVLFATVASMAWRVCEAAGLPNNVQEHAVTKAFGVAWEGQFQADAVLRRSGLPDKYVREEIERVIKGRGIDDVATYLALSRTGRIVRLDAALREAIWRVHEAWTAVLTERGLTTYEDVLRGALETLRETREKRYDAVILDEAQDVTLLQAAFLTRLSDPLAQGRVRDGLFIAGDGAQRIYPGGYRLRDAGIDVQGRSQVLRLNYRNTHEILTVARKISRSGTFSRGFEEDYPESGMEGVALRHGVWPLLIEAPTEEAELSRLEEALRSVVSQGMVSRGDIAIGVPTNSQVERVARWFKSQGHQVQKLDRYTGDYTPQMKVGTLDRLKGLEFKVVCLPFMTLEELPPTDDDILEWVARVCVGVTRARDLVIFTCSENPSVILTPVLSDLTIA